MLVTNYSYEDAPTLYQFHLSDARIRAVMGPFGSGKSSCCLFELIQKGLAQKPGRDGIRRTRFAIIRNCYDDKTEVLTDKRGWKLFKDLQPDDKVATLHGDNLVYEYPLYYYESDYNGEMITLNLQNVDLKVTPNHKLYVSKINSKTKIRSGYHFRYAQDIYGQTSYELKTNANWNGGESEYSEKFFEFLGLWYAEGNADIYNGRYHLVISQKKYTEYVEKLLNDNGLEWSKCDKGNSNFNYRIKINDNTRNIIHKLKNVGKSLNKYLPLWIKEAPATHLRAFVHGFIIGDGHYKQGPRDSTRLFTASAQLANDLQEIIFKSGYSSILNKHSNLQYYITILTDTRNTPQPSKRHWGKENYNGKVYCVEVSTHIIYVRRNGKAVWCSQTYSQLKDSTIRTVLYWFPEIYYGKYRIADHNYIITAFENTEIELNFRALDRPDQVDNLLSVEYTGAWINEFREVPKAVLDHLDGRLGRFPPKQDGGATWKGIVMDTNPFDTDSPYYKIFEVEKPEGWVLFKQPSGLSKKAENRKWLVDNYYEDLMIGKDPSYVNVYVHGNYGYIKEGIPVFEHTYNDELHVYKEELKPVDGRELIIGIDAGLTPAAAICQITPLGFFNVLDELISNGIGMQQFANNMLSPLLNTKYHGYKHICVLDPSAYDSRSQTDEKTCREVLEMSGFKVERAKSNDLSSRIMAVEGLLSKMTQGKPTFRLNQNCGTIRAGFNSKYCYRRLKVSEDRYTESPSKNSYSHIMDALQYAAMYVSDNIMTARKKRRRNHSRWQPSSIAGY